MRSILYIIAVILIIGWLLGQFGGMNLFGAGSSLIHILLVLAIISLLLGFIRRGSV
ncbi:MAG: lmo0937 family membrane protein [Sphingobacteriales bacterium]|nr:MAG: lmo0937 family membrane protein [Sphingobacteriales bacterium]